MNNGMMRNISFRTFLVLAWFLSTIMLILVITLALITIRDDDLSPAEQTATTVVLTNVYDVHSYFSPTLTALTLLDWASQTALAHHEETATADYWQHQTQTAQLTQGATTDDTETSPEATATPVPHSQ
jgi:hypothetical protein